MTPEAQAAFLKIRAQLSNVVFYYAHKYKNFTPGCEFDDLCQTGELKLLELFQSGAYKRLSEKELLSLLHTSLRNVMIDTLRGREVIDHSSRRIDLEDASHLIGESGFEALYLQHLVDYLGYFVSDEARLLLQNLIQPSAEVIHEDLVKSLRREHLRRQGIRVSSIDKLTHNLVGSVLGFTNSKTKLLIRELQEAYCHHVINLPGAPCPRLYHSLTLS